MIKNRRKPIPDDAKTVLLIVGALDEIQGHGGFAGFGGDNIRLRPQGRSDYQALKASGWRPSRGAFIRMMAEMYDDPRIEPVATGLMMMLGMYTDMDDSDGDLQAVVAFRARIDTPEATGSSHTALATAHKIFTEDSPQRWELEARLLAGQTDATIAERCGLTEESVTWYESIFFSIRGSLKAVGYIRQHVIGAGIDCGFRNDELRAFWAWLTFSGQPAIIELLIDTFHRVHRPDEAPTLSVYLRPDADVAGRLQAFVASAVLPHFGPAGKAWAEINLLQFEAKATADPDRAAFLLERARNHLIGCTRALLAGKPLPKFRRPPAQTAKRSPSNGRQQGTGIRRALADDPVLRAMADDPGQARVLMDCLSSR